MGKHPHHDKSDARSRERGIKHYKRYIRGILHVLNYHHFTDVGKMLPPRKSSTLRQVIWCTKPRTSSMEREAIERRSFLDAEAGRVQVEHLSEKPSAMAKPKRDQKDTDCSPSRSPQKVKRLDGDFPHQQVEEYIDILETFNVNKDLFVSFFKEPDAAVSKQLYARRIPNKLTKSGSFPLPHSSTTRNHRPATLEQKLMERWSFPRGESILVTLKIPKPEDDVRRFIKHRPEELVKHGWLNHKVMSYLKEIMQRIQQALGARKKAKKRVDNQGFGNDHPPRVNRTSSLNESMDKYAQLFAHSFRQDAKFHSKSLKLHSEDKAAAKRQNLKFFRRNSSLSDIESFGLLLNEMSHESFSSESAMRKCVDNNTNVLKVTADKEKAKEPDAAAVEAESQGAPGEGGSKDTSAFSGLNEDTEGSPGSPRQDRDLAQENSASDRDSSSPNYIPVGMITQGSRDESRPTSTIVREDLTVKVEKESENLANQDSENLYLHFRVRDEEATLFAYVRDVLELSGFLKDKHMGGWHWDDQPLSPSLFKELESRMQHQPDRPQHETLSSCDHSILFDLINEALVETYERSITYFPRTFSFTRQICPTPNGQRVLSEVWSRASSHISSGSKADQTLDDLVGRDLGKVDGWMNFQAESESLVFELEDLILDQLLDEVFC